MSDTNNTINTTVLNLMVSQKVRKASRGSQNETQCHQKINKVRKTLTLLKNTVRFRKKKPTIKLKKDTSKMISNKQSKALEEINNKFTFDADEVVFQSLSVSVSGIGRLISAITME
jgi:hypothetical protein